MKSPLIQQYPQSPVLLRQGVVVVGVGSLCALLSLLLHAVGSFDQPDNLSLDVLRLFEAAHEGRM